MVHVIVNKVASSHFSAAKTSGGHTYLITRVCIFISCFPCECKLIISIYNANIETSYNCVKKKKDTQLDNVLCFVANSYPYECRFSMNYEYCIH